MEIPRNQCSSGLKTSITFSLPIIYPNISYNIGLKRFSIYNYRSIDWNKRRNNHFVSLTTTFYGLKFINTKKLGSLTPKKKKDKVWLSHQGKIKKTEGDFYFPFEFRWKEILFKFIITKWNFILYLTNNSYWFQYKKREFLSRSQQLFWLPKECSSTSFHSPYVLVKPQSKSVRTGL